MLAGLYQRLPASAAGELLIGSTVAAVLLQVLIVGFSWYLSSGLVNYWVTARWAASSPLLVFVYLISFIILFGVYLAAAAEGRQQAPQMLGWRAMGGPDGLGTARLRLGLRPW